MKTKELKSKLAILGTAITKNPIVPILENILLKDETLRASNIETEVVVTVPGFKGVALFPYHLLKKTIDKLNVDNDIVLVATGEQSSGIEIDGKVKFKFNDAGNDKDFPKKRKTDDKLDTFRINEQDMKTINKAFKFTDTDELRPALTCVCINSEHIAATNSHQLLFKKHNIPLMKEILISNNASASINKLKGDVELEVSKETITLWDNEIEISIKRIDEKFPDYKAVIPDPESRTTKLMVKRTELINILQQADICANTTTHQAILTASNNKLTIISCNTDFGTEFKDQISIISINKFHAGFNVLLFIGILKEFDQDTVTIESNGKSHSAIVVNGEHLLMPVMINNNNDIE